MKASLLKLDDQNWTTGPNGLKSRWVLVTPEMAKNWLEKNQNRKKRLSTITHYLHMILRGQWHTHHQGVAFDVDGWLRDGQHRLSAIEQSGKSMWLLVTINISREAVMVLDIQAKRTDSDALNLMGVQDVNHTSVAVIKHMALGIKCHDSGNRLSRDDLMSLALAWHEPILFTKPMWSSKHLRHAAISAAIARAWFTQDHERLAEFMDVAKSGEIKSPADTAAIRLRDWISQGHHSGGRIEHADRGLQESIIGAGCVFGAQTTF
jgi:hypothetical protein